MPIRNYNGKTFVAFTDISGFKELMKREQAWDALDRFYTIGYHALHEHNLNENIKVDGMFVSDCCVLFVRIDDNNEVTLDNYLAELLMVIKELNIRMLGHDYMLTTSIVYGDFRYQDRIEFDGIEKNPIYGNAYVEAFLDNEKTLPRLQPGQCRIVINQDVKELFANREELNPALSLVTAIPKDGKHLRYYWNLQNENEIEDFEDTFKDAYNLKFLGMLNCLKGYRR